MKLKYPSHIILTSCIGPTPHTHMMNSLNKVATIKSCYYRCYLYVTINLIILQLRYMLLAITLYKFNPGVYTMITGLVWCVHYTTLGWCGVYTTRPWAGVVYTLHWDDTSPDTGLVWCVHYTTLGWCGVYTTLWWYISWHWAGVVYTLHDPGLVWCVHYTVMMHLLTLWWCISWGIHHQQAYFDVRVFNPLATSNRQSAISTCFRSHDREKRRVYEQRVRDVERGSFTPLVFSALGGVSRPTEVTYKRLTSLLASKRDQPYNIIISFLRCWLSFSLLRSAIMCLRGSRSTAGHPRKEIDFTLAVSEGRLSLTD